MCSASVSTTGPTEARGVLLVASLAQLVVAAGLALAIDSVAAILVLATLLGIGFAFAQPAEFSLVPVGAGGDHLTKVSGLVETARYAGMTAARRSAVCWPASA